METSKATHVSKWSELRLSRWLQRRLGVLGALNLVRQHGSLTVLTVLHDQVLDWDLVEGRWLPHAKLHNPAGFLRWALVQHEAIA